MNKRYLAIWFPFLMTDRIAIKQTEFKTEPIAIIKQERNKQIICNVNHVANKMGIHANMPLADARIIIPTLTVFKQEENNALDLLKKLAEWCIRYTPYVAINLPDVLFLNITGCTHLWKNEANYVNDISNRLTAAGYHIKTAIADTMAAAWGVAHYDTDKIIAPNQQLQALQELPAQALQLDEITVQKLHKLGFTNVNSFINIAPSTLRRRFGNDIIQRINQALGTQPEAFTPIIEHKPYCERLQCLEPITTAKGIEIAIETLLDKLCERLKNEDIGIRTAQLNCYRLDGKLQQINIGTNLASIHINHLFKLFELKIKQITPALGIELFVMEATKTEPLNKHQEALWQAENHTDINEIAELLDRISMKAGKNAIRRYLPQPYHWPENSITAVNDLNEQPQIDWPTHKPRPSVLLNQPELIKVSAPIPDYPPMNFTYQNEIHRIVKADGPERIEQEWWLNDGKHRDYYYVEDEKGQRYWLFRLGHYNSNKAAEWFIHGFFA